MKHHEFRIGGEFTTDASITSGQRKKRWRCTDIGTRTIIAIRLDHVDVTTSTGGKTTYQGLTQDEASMRGWFNGPPYAIAEHVFDEDAQCGCQSCASK